MVQHGTKGFVTNVLETLADDFAVYYSCGPTPMLAALEKMYPEKEGYLIVRTANGLWNWCMFCMCL